MNEQARITPQEAQRRAGEEIAKGENALFEKVGNAPDGLPIFGASKDSAVPAEERRRILGLTEHADALALHGNTLRDRGKYAASAIAFRRALALCPDNAFLLNGLGASLWFLSQYSEAHSCIRRSLALNPADPGTHSNMGTLMATLGRIAPMREHFEKAIAIEPANHSARWNYAMALLDLGLWLDAWPHYEVRMAYSPDKFPKMPYPYWKGQNLDGKTLYVQAEQGFGDRVLFSRYLSWVHEQWPTARILLLTESPPMPDMRPLLWGFHDFVEFLPAGTPWPEDVDYGVFEMSLPGIHRSTPDYVPRDPGLIRKRVLPDADGVRVPDPLVPAIKVGVCWSGNPLMMRNSDRSMPLELMLQLEEVPNVQLYGLQFAPGRADIARVGAHDLMLDLSEDIEKNSGTSSFVGTCAIMSTLDMVITVCTANAHLAGAMGVPTWVALCHDPYWVWLRGRSDSPWYPNTKLYRQREPNDWQFVIDRMKRSLSVFAEMTLENKAVA